MPMKLSHLQEDGVKKAKKYAQEQSFKQILLRQTITHQKQQLANMQTNVQRQQALALMCRVYVGTINFEIKEDTIKQAFIPFGPIKSISLPYDSISKKHKGFAFIEYDIPEAASLALEQMNGVMIGGFSIKVGRPSNMPQAQPIIETLLEESKSYNRIYVASIHQDLAEKDIQSVFEAFGKIKSCKLSTDPMRPGKHKGYGYIEYETGQSAHDAVSAMNLFDLGGQYLRVGKAVTPPNASAPTLQGSLPTASAIAAAAVTAQITALEAANKTIEPPEIAIPEIDTTTVMPPVVTQLGVSLGTSPAMMPLLTAAASASLMLGGSVMPVLPPQSAALDAAMHVSLPQSMSTGLSFGLPFPTSTISAMTVGFGGAMPLTTMGVPMSSGIPAPVPGIPGGIDAAQLAASHLMSQMSGGLAQQLQVNAPELLEAAQTLQQQEDMQIKGAQARHMVMQKLMRPTESRVMVLKNMVGPEEVDEELENEVTDECSKYGKVEHVIIYQEKQSEDDDAETIVKIFVEFFSPEEMKQATASLNGRFFAGRPIQAVSYDQNLFDAHDLSA